MSEECINCGEPAPAESRMIRLVVVDTQGTLNELAEWPVCPDCDLNDGTLQQYAAFALR